ncbi:MAG: hypothetical protein OXE77_08960 [Flavobacteriaceae bacterium]|nr:hypothetical protein [Flavobacteriaceae bacterium]MCY4268511.1 hypothetical protein [Flavobacteriaceae bacterium]
MKKALSFLCLLIGILLLTIACQKETTTDSVEFIPDSELDVSPKLEQESLPPGDEMILGDPINSPHTIENMKKALKNLRQSARAELPGKYEITTTHHYIKLYPQSDAHIDTLSQYRHLILFNYPLDREILRPGSYYVDPNAPKDKPMPLYTTIRVDDELPQSVPYEIILKLHNPQETEDYDIIETARRKTSFFDLLENESYKLTNNDAYQSNKAHYDQRSWRPSGTIKAYDSTTGTYVGVKGLKIELRSAAFFPRREDIFTDSNGYFRATKSFGRSINYSFRFERHDFRIRYPGRRSSIQVESGKRNSSWSLSYQ